MCIKILLYDRVLCYSITCVDFLGKCTERVFVVSTITGDGYMRAHLREQRIAIGLV